MVAGVFVAAVHTNVPVSEQPDDHLAASENDLRTREIGETPISANIAEPTSELTEGTNTVVEPQDHNIIEAPGLPTNLPEREVTPTASTEPVRETRGASVEAYGPYGTKDDPKYEGEPILFESDIVGGSNMDYRFRWDVTGDGLWDGPGAGPDGWGAWGETDLDHEFCDNSMGDVVVQAWDGTWTTTNYYGQGWAGYDMTQNVAGYYTYTYGNQITMQKTVTVDRIGGYKSYYWWAYPYPYIPYFYENLRIWTTGGTSLRQTGPLYPADASWAWGDIPDIELTAGTSYVVSMHARQEYTSYPYYYCHPGTYKTDAPDNGLWDWDGYRYYWAHDVFPTYGPYSSYAFFVDLDVYWEVTVENVIEDTAPIWVDNVAPTVIDPQATVTVGQEGSEIEAVGWFDDPGTCDEWWYRWVWGDGTMTDWFKVNKFDGGARILFIHAYLTSYSQPVIDDIVAELGPFATIFDTFDYGPLGESAPPPLSTMLQYDLILTGNDYYVYDAAETLGDRLADFMDDGGAVVALTFANGFPPGGGIAGRFIDDEYNPVEISYNYFTWKSLGTIYPVPSAAEVFNGVGALGAYYGHQSTSTTSGATRIADWNNGHILCAEKTNPIVPNGAISFYINFCPYNNYVTGDYAVFVANSIKYASQMDDPTPKAMPIMTDPISHIYVDDHPTTLTHEDVFEATLEVKDDDHEKTITLGAPVTVHYQDFEDAAHSNDFTKGWYEAGDGQWYLTYPYYGGSGSWSAQRWYWPAGTSYLYSPVLDFSTLGGAIIDWDQYWWANWGNVQDGYVEISDDGGSTWNVLWEGHTFDPADEVSHQTAMWGAAAGQPSVQLRFRLYMNDNWLWEVDNIEIGYANTHTMEGLGSEYCLITIQNVFPTVLAPGAFVDVVDEMVTINFEGFEITDPALMQRTEQFAYRWDYGDGTPIGPWIMKGTIAPPPLKVLLLNSWASESSQCINGITGALVDLGYEDVLTIDEYNYYFNPAPPLSLLLDYDVVLTSTNYYIYDTGKLNALGNVLADYSDLGGGVVQMTFAGGISASGFLGRWYNEDYTPIPYTGNYYGYLSLGDVYEPEHTIMEGVADMQAYYSHGTGGVTAGATRLADYTNGNTLCAYTGFDHLAPGGGRIVGLNFFPWPSYVSGDAMRMCANSIIWAWGASIPTPVLDTVSHDYGDNGMYDVVIHVIDDDMWWDLSGSQPVFMGTGDPNDWVSFSHHPVEVLNVDPDVTPISAEVNLDLVIRTTGEPNNDCTMTLWQGMTALGSVTVHHDGNYKMESMPATLDMGSINDYYITVEYENADPDGANPTWVFEGRFPSGHCKELKNVFKEDGTIWTIDSGLLKGLLLGEDIVFSADGDDDGSDDLVFDWQFGDGGESIHVYANDGFTMAVGTSVAPENMPDAHPDRDPWFDVAPNDIRSPEMNPIFIGDEVSHAYEEAGYYYVTLILMDDDVCDGYPSYQYFMNGGGYDMEFYTVDLS